jgi:hypothetical protein
MATTVQVFPSTTSYIDALNCTTDPIKLADLEVSSNAHSAPLARPTTPMPLNSDQAYKGHGTQQLCTMNFIGLDNTGPSTQRHGELSDGTEVAMNTV